MERNLMKGNEALAEAAVRAGCRHYFGYPITPQNEIAAYMSKRLPKIGGVFIQAESEISAINMVYGCAAAGTRCMTSSSSPGISLKTEGISYLAGADLPCVIVNVQRGGPGLGSIQPSQADYWQATRALGHGDLRIPVLAPSTVQEMADMTGKAFDLADEYRAPVMILADGLLGQMMEPVSFPDIGNADEPRAKAVPKKWAAVGHGNSRGKNIINSLYLQPEKLEEKITERFKRYEEIKNKHAGAVSENCDGADIVIAAYGATARIARSAAETAREKGIKAGTFRPLTLYPFPEKELREACKTAKKVLVAEMSMGQMVDDVKLALECKLPVEFFGRTGGFIPGPGEILNKITEVT
ncbi:MAG: 3-methyl-2-oxobutanoate dehydrogenase subunit VorB [Oscillospiraceae bacterium]|jgi:2-oxoglutarate ferredoxin oxidoreductase subunit alpha|nr:3-methyl-2-oxobutanoate dehydrogenase subunit VorB [Oscillospiraceae bacterium]